MSVYINVQCPRCKSRYRIPATWLGTRHYCDTCKLLGYPQAGYPIVLVPLAGVASVEAKENE